MNQQFVRIFAICIISLSRIFSFKISYSAGIKARIHMRIYRELGVIDNRQYDRYMRPFDDELYYEKLHGHPPQSALHIIEFEDNTNKGKCAFVGYYNQTTFFPYFTISIRPPDIRPAVISNSTLDTDFTNIQKTPSYLEYIFQK